MSIQKYAVIGDPIKHSLSPPMQNAGFKALGVNAEYSTMHVCVDGLADFCDFARQELFGFNITVPHKKNIIPFLDEVSEEARLAESVNTVVVMDGKLSGHTTDGYGLATAIDEAFGIKTLSNSFCFVGCGGAVQAVSFYFAANGADNLFFVNRTASKAETLVQRLRNSFPGVNAEFCPLDDEKAIASFIARSSVLIQGTSLGLREDDPPPLKPELLKGGICFYDTIYKKTPLMKYAQDKGIRFSDGRGMLLHQGAKALSLWTRTSPPIEAMRKALYGAMESREKSS